LKRYRENSFGQEGLERCGCRPMPPGGEKVKKKKIYNKIYIVSYFIAFVLMG
jgi:hypothetical protein